jgi:hypothetical protein
MSRPGVVILVSILAVAVGCGGRIDSGNAEGVTISGLVETQADALRVADAHCAQYGKAARIQQIAPPRSGRRVWNFICVLPGSS